MNKSRAVVTTALAVGALTALTACGAAPAPNDAAATSDTLACIVSDSGGFDDRSFNQLGLEGLQAAAEAAGAEIKSVQSKTSNDYTSNIGNLVTQGCDVIVGSGFNLVAAIDAAAQANPDVDFVMVDDNSIDLPNVKSVVFDTAQAAFLGGYAAAAYSSSGTIATYGGAQYPSVTVYMDGLADGVAYYNDQHGASVRVLGWNKDTQEGTFVGNFTDQNASKTITQNFLDQGADVVVPVGGPLYQGAAAAITASGSDAVLEGVDADIHETDTSATRELFLTSILKNIRSAVEDVVAASLAGDFDNTPYIGVLANDGVGLAPFHAFEDRVPTALADDLDTIRQQIVDGEISVTSPSSPR